MRVPRVQFTMRRLMVVVAIAALGFGLIRRWTNLAREADYHAKMETYYRAVDAGALDGAMCKRREIEHHARMGLVCKRWWWSPSVVVPRGCHHPAGSEESSVLDVSREETADRVHHQARR
jgi:hypothetical protein